MAALLAQDAQRVAAVRRFNRFYTQHLGCCRMAGCRARFRWPKRGCSTRCTSAARRPRPTSGAPLASTPVISAGFCAAFTSSPDPQSRVAGRCRQSLLSLTARAKGYAPLETRTKREIGAMLGRLNRQSRIGWSGRCARRTMIAPAPQPESESSCAAEARRPRWVVAATPSFMRRNTAG